MTTSQQFKKIISNPAEQWRQDLFDLKFDAKWTNQPGCIVHMDESENLFVKVEDREAAGLSGMRFSTGEVWVKHSIGERVKIDFETRTSTTSPLELRAVYLPRDCPHSGFINTTAGAEASTFSFEFEIPAETTAQSHFIVIEPLIDNVELVIVRATMEIL